MTLFTPLRDLLGADVFQIPGEFDPARHVHDFLVGAPEGSDILGIAYPRSTQEVSQILRFCNDHDIKVTPQGGMTGLAGGGVPVGATVVLSLERMRAIEEIAKGGEEGHERFLAPLPANGEGRACHRHSS